MIHVYTVQCTRIPNTYVNTFWIMITKMHFVVKNDYWNLTGKWYKMVQSYHFTVTFHRHNSMFRYFPSLIWTFSQVVKWNMNYHKSGGTLVRKTANKRKSNWWFDRNSKGVRKKSLIFDWIKQKYIPFWIWVDILKHHTKIWGHFFTMTFIVHDSAMRVILKKMSGGIFQNTNHNIFIKWIKM